MGGQGKRMIRKEVGRDWGTWGGGVDAAAGAVLLPSGGAAKRSPSPHSRSSAEEPEAG